GLDALEALLGARQPQAGVLQADWKKIARLPGLPSRLLADLDSPETTPSQLPQRLEQALPEQQQAVLAAHVREAVAGVFCLEPEGVREQARCFEQGMDSLMAVDLANRLQRDIGSTAVLSSTVVLDHPTVERLTAHLAGLLFAQPAARVPVAVRRR